MAKRNAGPKSNRWKESLTDPDKRKPNSGTTTSEKNSLIVTPMGRIEGVNVRYSVSKREYYFTLNKVRHTVKCVGPGVYREGDLDKCIPKIQYKSPLQTW